MQKQTSRVLCTSNLRVQMSERMFVGGAPGWVAACN